MNPSIAAHYYCKPAFRRGVKVLVGDTRAVFTYDLTTFDVELNALAAAEVDRLCSALHNGLDLADVPQSYPDFAPYVWELIEAFDRYGFLLEVGAPKADEVITSKELWRQVQAFSQRAARRFRPVFYESLRAGVVGRGALVRYAQEYFHVVTAGPKIIAGALPHATTVETTRLLERFLQQEIGHELLLAKSLAAVGIDPQLARSQLPLPQTFAITTTFQTLADQEPLAFKALVFLLEEANPEFGQAFVASCRKAGLGEAFWAPIVRHANINDGEDHGSISARLLEDDVLVSREETLLILKHAAAVVEALVEFERAVLDPVNALGG